MIAAAPLALGLALASAPEPPPQASPTPIAVSLGGVRARVACERARESAVFCRPTRLEIFRDETKLYEDRFEGVTSYLSALPDRAPLAARDLDGDGETEILLDLFSGGAHCCWSTRLYHLVGRSLRYDVLTHDWGNAGYRLEDPGGDGRTVFVGADDAFSYAFTSYAASRRPPRYWRYERGRLTDVTRRYPAAIEADAAEVWKVFEELAPSDSDGGQTRGLAAAYVADLCLLGRCGEGWRRLRAAYDKPDREKFFRELSSLLQKNGYVLRRRYGAAGKTAPTPKSP